MQLLGCRPVALLGAIFRFPSNLIDQFVSEGVLIPDISCSHASPLVIVHKKEGGFRMKVDYREVNRFLRVSANQLHQDILFQQLEGQLDCANVDNLWRYHQLNFDQQSSKVTAIITPRGVCRFYLVPWEFQLSRWTRVAHQELEVLS